MGINNSNINHLADGIKLVSLTNQYIIQHVIGQGGFGIVYLALDKQNQKVAIKEYFPRGLASRSRNLTTVTTSSEEISEYFKNGAKRFYEEAKTMVRFKDDKNIVQIKDFFWANNTAYIVMEYLEGKTFLQILKAQPDNRLTLAETLANLKPVVQALSRMHTMKWTDNEGKPQIGVIHRDVSPENIMFSQDGLVKLMDFGSARSISLEGEFKLTSVVKAGYAPPEQFIGSGVAGAQGPWTDVYALAATIYRAITGFLPQNSQQRSVNDELKLLSLLGIPITQWQESVLLKGMALDYHYRYQSINQFYEDLERTDDEHKSFLDDKRLRILWGIACCFILMTIAEGISYINIQSENNSAIKKLNSYSTILDRYKDIEENYGNENSNDFYAKQPLLVLDSNGESRTLEFFWNGKKEDLKTGSGIFSLEPMQNLDVTMVHGDKTWHALGIKSKTNVKNVCYPMKIYNTKNNEEINYLVVIR